MAQALSHVVKTRTERAYCDAALALIPIADGYVTPELRREQVAGLNELVASGTRLDAVRSEIAAGLSSATPETLRAEIADLQARADRVTDPATRDALARSVALCAERLERAEAMTILTGRVEAEQELVYQAFRMAQSSIASLRVSPVGGSDVGAASVADIAATIGRQTRAVEAAVQELGIRAQ